jgi:LysM repeat protein
VAQYGHNWYGTSYYGATNAFSGWYQTNEVFTEEALKGTANIRIRAALPTATYGPTAPEVDQMAGTWTYDSSAGKLYSSNTNAQLYMQATCDEIVIQYEQRTIAAKVNIKVVTVQPGVADITNNYVLNTQSTVVSTTAGFKISGLPFGKQQITITMAADSPAGANFNFKGFTARTANLIVESRARVTYDPNHPMADSDYVKLTTTITNDGGSNYIISATTPNYAGKKYIQLKVYLASSDNETTPEVQWIEFSAGDTSNRTPDGQWTGIFNMAQIATLAGVSFQKVEEVVWTENVPPTTTLTIRSQSVINNTAGEWSLAKLTVPYKLNTNRIRLKEGFNYGYLDAPLLAPASKVPYVHVVDWINWSDQSFRPPDNAGVNVIYDFLSVQKDNTTHPYHSITNPMLEGTNHNLRGNKRLKNLDTVLRITLSRPPGKQTPVVDFINISSLMHYEQDVEIKDQAFSAVDFNNTGKGVVLDMTLTSWQQQYKIPTYKNAPEFSAKYNLSTTSTSPIWQLIDSTARPQDVILYYENEATKAVRDNWTPTMTTKVWAQSKAYSSKTKTGLVKHYQYGGGEVRFPNVSEIHMDGQFTSEDGKPMPLNKKYRYYLLTGWPQQYYITKVGDTLITVAETTGKDLAEIQSLNTKLKYNNDGTLVAGQSVKVPNHTVNDNVNVYWKTTSNNTTSKSALNTQLDGSSPLINDSIMAEVKESSIYGWTNWVSEEKKYDGVVNLNDIASGYSRTHSVPDSGDSTEMDYVVLAGDTYKSIAAQFGVYEEDVRLINDVTNADAEPIAGDTIKIPSKVTLPAIHPQAVVSDNPYEITMVFRSVKKKDGKILSEEVIVPGTPTVTYHDVTITDWPMKRGSIPNGKDPLPHPRVKQILSAKSADGMITYNPWNDQLGIGNVKLTDGYADWSSSEAEPAVGADYFISYVIEAPKDVTVSFETTYMEEGGVDRIWRSPEVKQFEGMCYPGRDYVMPLPDFNEWKGLPNNSVEDLTYVIEDNDIWVKTWAEQRNDQWVIVGSLQDRVPKDNWFPRIKTGYYYLGRDEYYLFNEPITLEPGEMDIPVAENVEFVEGKFMNAAKLQEGSQNLIRNSGFEIRSTKKTVYKDNFGQSYVAGLGVTN